MVGPNNKTTKICRPNFSGALGVLLVAAGGCVIEHNSPTRLVPNDWASRLLIQVKNPRYQVRSCERGKLT